MLHHVSIELLPADVEPFARMLEAIGFERVTPPKALKDALWLEREGTQVHLLEADDPAVPARGHAAFVASHWDVDLAALQALGYEPRERTRYWGEPRVLIDAPGGHIVELMAAPPAPGT